MRTRHFAIAIGVATASLAISALRAQNPNLERVTNDRYARSHDYDLVHQRISVRDFDWDSTSFKGSVTTTLVALRPGLDSVILDARGAALRSSRHGDTLVVFLAKPAAFRDTVRFTIDYDGKVDNGQGLTFIAQGAHAPRQIWSQGEDHDNHYWFPTYDFPNDKMTWELEAAVPSGYVAVSNGALVSDVRGIGGVRTMTWSQMKPSPTYLVSLIVAPLAKVHDTWKGVPVDYYVYHTDSTRAWRLFHVTSDMIDTYSRLTGVPYPWAKYAQTTVANFFGGMENVSATTLVDWMPDAKAYQDRPWFQYILIPHELAHQWFGDYMTTENWANLWLNEGFAEFMPGQYWLAKSGAHLEEDYYLDEYRQFMDIDLRQRMPLAALASNNIYPKGALVLEMLKHYLGDDRFWAGINKFLTTHAFGNAVTDDLRQAFLSATGENLDWFFDEWVYSAGYPDFVVTQAYDAAARRVTLVVKQMQRDTLKADSTGLRFAVTEAFRMPVTVRVGTTAGDVVSSTWIRNRDDTIVVNGVSSAPTMVVFDDRNRILKSLAFDQPTAMLATQLRRDPDLWNRAWVLGQLETRKADAAAGAALAEAATSADYFLTRQQAAEALAGFPAAVALPALEHAMRDTSSQVRAAAAVALAQMRGPQALALARRAWENDSSYIVRAAALSTLAALDSANRRALIVQGLRTPSYRDAIRNAALGVAVGSGDTTLVAAVREAVDESRQPLYALAALALRGSQDALSALVAYLNDPRPLVRRYALGAIAQTLAPNVGLPALKSAQGSLTHPETRAAVEQVIRRLESRVQP